MSFDYSEWLGDKLSSDECCLSESEAEALELEKAEQERLKNICARALLALRLVPRSFITQRFWK